MVMSYNTLLQGKLGGEDIVNDILEYRSAYALVGFTGIAAARKQMGWIREELSKAGEGPSVISVQIDCGKKEKQ